MISVMREDKAGMQLFTRYVGRGSNWQVDDLDLKMSLVILETVGSLKLASGELMENVSRDWDRVESHVKHAMSSGCFQFWH